MSFPSANTYVTLRDLLDKQAFPKVDTGNSEHYSLSDRYLLGLNLAKSLFYLFDGPWRPLNWKAEDIYFPATQTSTSVTIHSHHSPYIRFDLETGDERENQIQKRKEEIERFCYPMWLALAQILLELRLGRSLAHECDEAVDKVEQRQILGRIIDTELRDSDPYKEAVRACFNFGFKLLAFPLRQIPEEARKLIRNSIIAKLEEKYEECSSALGEYTDLDLTPNQQSQKAEDIAVSPLNKDTMAITPVPTLSFRQWPPARRTQAESTFHLAPRFTIKPPPDGPLHLGTIIESLTDVEPINENCRFPLPGEAYKHITEGIVATRSMLQTGKFGVWAKFLVERIGGEVSLTRDCNAEDAYRFEKLEEITFTATKEYMTQSMNEQSVKDYVEGGGWDPVYMITGLKIARGPAISWQKGRKSTMKASLGLNQPNDVEYTSESTESWEFEKSDDFIYGIRVKRLYFKRSLLSGKRVVIAEDIDEGDEEMEGKKQVMDKEEIWVTPI